MRTHIRTGVVQTIVDVLHLVAPRIGVAPNPPLVRQINVYVVVLAGPANPPRLATKGVAAC
jgi:hypothetical protein